MSGATGPEVNLCIYSRTTEFWRVVMQPSDRLTLDFGATGQEGVTAEILAPSVTDYTLDKAHCLAQETAPAGRKTELQFVAPTAGQWIVAVRAEPAGTQPDVLAYEMTARVQAFTRNQVDAPRLVARGKPIKITGTVTGGTPISGGVVARLSAKGERPVTKVLPIRNEHYTWVLKLSKAGVYRLTITFLGDRSHLPSKTSASVRVA